MGTQRLAEGSVLGGRYEILEVIGRGGMGTVYRARDERLEIVVAVKEMTERDDGAQDHETAVRQFQREARLLAQLSHPNLPRVTDYFVEGDRWYLIMEFVRGVTLDSLLRESAGRPLPLSDALQWAVQIIDVLAYLHGQEPPIIFRDLKPANVMLQPDGIVKLIDFGIARRFHSEATKDTLLYGSPGYSPPEQYGRTQTSPRSDVYAFGATLHHLVTGRDPAPTPFRFPSASSLNPAVPQALDAFLASCLEMDEDNRWPSARQAQDTLVQIRGAVMAAPPIPAPEEIPPAPTAPERPTGPRVVSTRLQQQQERRAIRRLLLAAAAVLLVAFMAAFAFRSWPARRAPRAPTAPAPSPPVVTPGENTTPAVLRITSDPPGARIYLDNQDIGPAPQTIATVRPGAHTLRLVPPPGRGLVESTQTLEVQAGEQRTVPVPLSAASRTVSGGAPAATIQSLQAQMEPARAALVISGAARVTGAAGKSGVVAVFFYAADGATPLKPARPGSPNQNAQGLLSASQSFEANVDPQDVLFTMNVPAGDFTPDPRSTPMNYQVIVFVEGKPVGKSELRAWTQNGGSIGESPAGIGADSR